MITMELTAAEAWARILERARGLLPEPTYRLWLGKTEPLALSEGVLTVAAGNEFAAEWIEDKYGEFLTELAERLFGQPMTIAFEHRGPRRRDTADLIDAVGVSRPVAPVPPVEPIHRPPVTLGAPLNERYLF